MRNSFGRAESFFAARADKNGHARTRSAGGGQVWRVPDKLAFDISGDRPYLA
jgi:hypothetical protein